MHRTVETQYVLFKVLKSLQVRNIQRFHSVINCCYKLLKSLLSYDVCGLTCRSMLGTCEPIAHGLPNGSYIFGQLCACLLSQPISLVDMSSVWQASQMCGQDWLKKKKCCEQHISKGRHWGQQISLLFAFMYLHSAVQGDCRLGLCAENKINLYWRNKVPLGVF